MKKKIIQIKLKKLLSRGGMSYGLPQKKIKQSLQ